MKKKITALFIIFIFSFFLFACNNLTDEYVDQVVIHDNADVSETKYEDEDRELKNTLESNDHENVNDKTLSNLPIGGGNYTFNREFIDEVYNIYLITEIVGQQARDEWVNNVFLQQTEEEMNALPTIYQAIRDLNISREQFESKNDSYAGTENYFSDEIIDALYCGNEEEMKILLANPYALVYDGEIYTFDELSKNPALISASGIPMDKVKEYLDYIESVLENAGILKYEQERIDNLREYCETGE